MGWKLSVHVLRSKTPSGFTLVELLVVMFLMGVLGGMVLLALPTRDPSRLVQGEAQRLARFLQDAAAEAILGSRPMGMWVARRGYRLAAFDPDSGRWRLPDQEADPRPRELPEGMTLTMWRERQSLFLMEGLPVADRTGLFPAGNQPQVLFAPSGEVTSFRLRVTLPGEQVVAMDLVGHPLGRVTFDQGKQASWQQIAASP